MKYYVTVQDQEFEIVIDQDDQIVVNGQSYQIDFRELPDAGMVSLLINNRSLEAVVEERDNTWETLIKGELYTVKVEDERAYRLARARGSLADTSGESSVKSPMPGIIVKTPVAEGEHVRKGQTVVILESMKMENELKAPRDGLVTQVKVDAGDSVEKDQVLVVIGEDEED